MVGYTAQGATSDQAGGVVWMICAWAVVRAERRAVASVDSFMLKLCVELVSPDSGDRMNGYSSTYNNEVGEYFIVVTCHRGGKIR